MKEVMIGIGIIFCYAMICVGGTGCSNLAQTGSVLTMKPLGPGESLHLYYDGAGSQDHGKTAPAAYYPRGS